MRHHGIKQFVTDSNQNAAVVERFNRTMKTRLRTYMSEKGTVQLLNVL